MNVTFRALRSSDWSWIKPHIHGLLTEDTKGIIAEDEAGKRIAGCVCDNWTHNSVQVHLFVLKAMVFRHGWLEEIADYIFNQAEKNIVYGLVPSNNAAALKLNKHVGFVELIRLHDAINFGVDMVVMELRKEDCVWLHQRAA